MLKFYAKPPLGIVGALFVLLNFGIKKGIMRMMPFNDSRLLG